VTAFAEVRRNLRRSAERNKRYYDLGLKPKQFAVGQWVLCFNPRKLRGKQMKWIRQYEGPLLITAMPSSLTAKIQKTAKTKAKTVHIDKLKEYSGTPLKSWMSSTTNDEATQGSVLPEIQVSEALEIPALNARIRRTKVLKRLSPNFREKEKMNEERRKNVMTGVWLGPIRPSQCPIMFRTALQNVVRNIVCPLPKNL